MDPRLPGIEHPSEALQRDLEHMARERGRTDPPRTQHTTSAGLPVFTNRLIREASPYLLQHAHNPVNWFAWGDEPFLRAAQSDRLILLSVGYSTCHWCHVMELESFEDEEIAAFVNKHYIAIKVDREERPDIDSVFMTVVQMMSGHGGWPMTVIMTPAGKPVFGGTYFPPRDGDRGSRTGFLTLLRSLDQEFQSSPERLHEQGNEVVERLRGVFVREEYGELPGPHAVRDTVVHQSHRFDPQWGGWGGAPKFPRSAIIELVARYARRTGDSQARHMVEHTLEKMSWGGIHDHVGGGFHRYSVDSYWLVPHFEKMLYDNAQLAVSYAEGWQLTGREDFAKVACSTCDYILREMSHELGGFFSATDADSVTANGAHEEGWFFTWSFEELEQQLSARQLDVVCTRYSVTVDGNFEGRNVLAVHRSDREAAESLGMTLPEFEEQLAVVHQRLYRLRAQRPAPLCDDKIIAAWNGLMVSALARVGWIFDEPRYRVAGIAAMKFVLGSLWSEGTLYRTWLAGSLGSIGFLDDHAFVIQGCLDLFAATDDAQWLKHAIELQHRLDEKFWDNKSGGYWYTCATHEELLAREKPAQDGAEPSGNSVSAKNLLRLWQLTGEAHYRDRAQRLFEAFGETLDYAGPAVPLMVCALEMMYDEYKQIVWGPGSRDALLQGELKRHYLPNAAVVKAETHGVEWSKNRVKPDDIGSVLVCVDGRCGRPASDPETLAGELNSIRPLFEVRVPPLRFKK